MTNTREAGDKEPWEVPDDATGNPFLSLTELFGKIPTATLESAIENDGIFILGVYGKIRFATEKEEAVARAALEAQYRWNQTPKNYRNEDFQPGYQPPMVDALIGSGDQSFNEFGWAKKVVPDELVPYLDDIRQDPDTQERWRNLVQPRNALNREKANWKSKSAVTTGDLAVQKANIAELDNKIAELERRAQVAGAHKPKGYLNYDPELQARANEIAEEETEKTGRKITKDKVAKILAREIGTDKATVLQD